MCVLSVTFEDPRDSNNEWIKFNRRQTGFYRVNYPPEMWQQLSNQLRTSYNVNLDLQQPGFFKCSPPISHP